MVIGLGYVGLSLAREASLSGLRVVGYDLNEEIVTGLNSGRSHVGDILSADVAEMLAKGFRATAAEMLQGHAAYDLDQISRTARLVLDTRGRVAGSNIARL